MPASENSRDANLLLGVGTWVETSALAHKAEPKRSDDGSRWRTKSLANLTAALSRDGNTRRNDGLCRVGEAEEYVQVMLTV